MGSETEMTGDTLAVTQLILVHLGVQVCKNDIMVLVTLNCLKFTKKKMDKIKVNFFSCLPRFKKKMQPPNSCDFYHDLLFLYAVAELVGLPCLQAY